MKDIPMSLVEKIYKKDYWNPCKAEGLSDQRLGNYLFDTGVNCGVRTACKMLQTAYNNLKKPKDRLKVDGKIGRLSLKAFNKMKPSIFSNVNSLFSSFVSERIRRYDTIIKRNKKLSSFKRGWYIRAHSF